MFFLLLDFISNYCSNVPTCGALVLGIFLLGISFFVQRIIYFCTNLQRLHPVRLFLLIATKLMTISQWAVVVDVVKMF